jgi:hypothetical protein
VRISILSTIDSESIRSMIYFIIGAFAAIRKS